MAVSIERDHSARPIPFGLARWAGRANRWLSLAYQLPVAGREWLRATFAIREQLSAGRGLPELFGSARELLLRRFPRRSTVLSASDVQVHTGCHEQCCVAADLGFD